MTNSTPRGVIRLEVEVHFETGRTGEGSADSWLAIREVGTVGTNLGGLNSTLKGAATAELDVLCDDIDADGLMVEAIRKALRDELAGAEEDSEDDDDN